MDTTLNDPLLGTLLDGRYRVEERIAVGGMATVYRGTDTRLDRVLALKVMHPSLAGDSGFTDRFIREAKAVARLSHPNVVNVFDQGADGGSVFLAMEYVPGWTLRDLLRDRGALSVRAALDVLEPVLAALGAAHRASLVHRDVKPENVLITDGGLVKVADFGLVRLLSGADTAVTDTTTPGVIMGTVSYLAPEQIQPSAATDQRVDVYAAGIMLYELLTGSKPYSGDNPMQVIYRHLHEDVPPPSLVVPGLAPELDAIVAAATSRDPQGRPWDAVELLAALQRVRRVLTPAQLDAEPPAASRPAPQFSPVDATSVLAAPVVERTSVFTAPPPSMITKPRPYHEPPRPPRRQRKPRSRRGLLWGSVLAVVALVVAGVSYLLSGAVYATVPSVLGQTQAQAVSTLDGVGLRGNFVQAFSESVPPGQVISSDPGVGQRARKSDAVKVTVSKGPERIAVPDVTGKPLDQAQQQLTAARLTPGSTTQDYSPSVPQGSVISTAPAAGQPLPVNAPVALVVSKGPAPVAVPDTTGLAVADAQSKLIAAGFKVALATDQSYSDSVAAGSVAAQDVTGTAAPGSTVTLTLSKGPQPVPVPSVTGMNESDATKALTAAGFKVRSSGLNFFGLSNVSGQSPTAGTMLPKGSTVTINF
ncbi:beta-lactam-binding protein with PASTA domain/serine/threonine protein kinase [Kitasatospora sp. GAS204A]|uniref:Stk1 family PASTA domain-containing Ser/Thr kinase n=1 Tax=unclassified Kitasatospora TaxID=2633591 RepID=UPI002473178E|nr:Stk1 family PASTA domain-containing Ser/Thr kinase [Kitasatospora sp. GAS204B]MDH6115896.1 beta-lactam-binding protein with PASTA domain/serine/threonine protein kinase [Kitasatospora sp. GAS204B]